jgi:hypothetical protein
MNLAMSVTPGDHLLEVMHPFEDIPLAAVFDYFERIVIGRDVLMKFPHGARLFVDGEDKGRLRDMDEI